MLAKTIELLFFSKYLPQEKKPGNLFI